MPNPAPLLTLLAQGPAAVGRVVFWCGVLLLSAAALALVAWVLRRRLVSEDDHEPLPMGFSLSDLRTLHARGELSDEEFEHAKRRMVAGTRARLEVEPSAAAEPAATGDGSPDRATDGGTEEPDGGIRWEDPPEDPDPGSAPPPDPGPDPSR